jgi:hypothetical protein
MLEAGDQLVTIQIQVQQPFIEVEQITVLVPLEQSPQFRAEKFLRRKRYDISSRLVPVAYDREGVEFQAVKVQMFSCVYLDFDLEIATA